MKKNNLRCYLPFSGMYLSTKVTGGLFSTKSNEYKLSKKLRFMQEISVP